MAGAGGAARAAMRTKKRRSLPGAVVPAVAPGRFTCMGVVRPHRERPRPWPPTLGVAALRDRKLEKGARKFGGPGLIICKRNVRGKESTALADGDQSPSARRAGHPRRPCTAVGHRSLEAPA